MHVLADSDMNNRSEPTDTVSALASTAIQVGTFQHGCKAVPCCQQNLAEM